MSIFTKLFSLAAAAIVSVSAFADEVILSGTTMNAGTNEISLTSNGAWKLAISGNTSKSWAASNNINYNKTDYKSLKNSNGAQNTITVPEGVSVSNVTFYAVANADAAATLSEFMGETKSVEVSSKKDFSNPTIISCDVANNPSAITFTFATKQVCFIAVVTYTQSGASSDIAVSSATDLVIKANETSQITATATNAISYSSSNEAVATVDASGTITAVAIGQAVISVKAAKSDAMLAGSKDVTVNVYDFESDATSYVLNDQSAKIVLTRENVAKSAFITTSKDLGWASRILDGVTYLLPNCNTTSRSLTIKFSGATKYSLVVDNKDGSSDRKITVKVDGVGEDVTITAKSQKTIEGILTEGEHTLFIDGVKDNTLYPYSLVLSKTETPTAIPQVNSEKYSNAAYNLYGQRVSENAKGTIIKNGKMTVVR